MQAILKVDIIGNPKYNIHLHIILNEPAGNYHAPLNT
jgi:hypothetical protein